MKIIICLATLAVLVTARSHLQKREKKETCADVVCQHGGSCEDQASGYWCHCAPKWKGPKCETEYTFMCNNGTKIPGDLQCDCETNDCAEGEDEANCNGCNLFGWKRSKELVCEDVNTQDCNAARDQGDCSQEKWAWRDCPKACGLCDTYAQQVCEDVNTQDCNAARDQGDCRWPDKWAWEGCPKACGRCDASEKRELINLLKKMLED